MRQGSTEKNITPSNLRTLPNSRREMSAAAKAQAFWGILPGVFSVSERDLCFLSFQMANSGPMVPTGPHRSCVVVIGSNSQDPPSPFLMEPDWDKFCHRPCPASDYSNCSSAQQALGDGSRIRSTPRDKKLRSTCYMDDSALPKIKRV